MDGMEELDGMDILTGSNPAIQSDQQLMGKGRVYHGIILSYVDCKGESSHKITPLPSAYILGKPFKKNEYIKIFDLKEGGGQFEILII